MILPVITHRYISQKFGISKTYQAFEMELPMSVRYVKAMAVLHDYHDAPTFSIGDLSIITREKNDIILKSALYPKPLFELAPAVYQKIAYQGSDPVESGYGISGVTFQNTGHILSAGPSGNYYPDGIRGNERYGRYDAISHQDSFLPVQIAADTRYLKVIVNKTPTDFGARPDLFADGNIRFNIWLTLVCENL